MKRTVRSSSRRERQRSAPIAVGSVGRLPAPLLVLVMCLLVLPATPSGASAVSGGHGASSAIVLDWERTSIRTIYPVNTPPIPATQTPIPVGALYLGFTSLAMYRAARGAGPHGSAEAAVATAAHDVLVAYFPAAATDLNNDLTASLATIPDGRAKERGRQTGKAVAAALIADRADDGRGDPTIVYRKDPAPGVWQPPAPPNPPLPGGMLAPWLGFVDPLILDQPIRPRGVNGPDPLTSARYAADFAEVQRLGSTASTDRAQAQTDTARFFNSNSAIMVSEGLLNYLDTRPMRLTDTARLFAAMHAAMSDAIITCWRLKYDVGFWRPFQAIQQADTDGNPATTADPTWTPLIANPPYSDYVSGHGCLTAPAVQAIRRTLGERTSLTLHSYVTNTDQSFTGLRQLEFDAFHARIWGGLHFRTAMDDAYAIGHTAADRVLRRLG